MTFSPIPQYTRNQKSVMIGFFRMGAAPDEVAEAMEVPYTWARYCYENDFLPMVVRELTDKKSEQ